MMNADILFSAFKEGPTAGNGEFLNFHREDGEAEKRYGVMDLEETKDGFFDEYDESNNCKEGDVKKGVQKGSLRQSSTT
jgi:hypothetical protein